MSKGSKAAFSALLRRGCLSSGLHSGGNGDITSDGLRGTAMAYNNNGSLKSISSGTDSMTYVNDADGGKLSTTLNGTLLNIYCGDFVYGPTLTVDHIRTPNGQMTRNATSGTYSAQCSRKPTTIPTDFPSQLQMSKTIAIFTTERNFGPSPAKVP